ncbi:MAG TPA: hypothetical protein VKT72_15155 [Candidatus Baltobacteraceae bacterium]|nr:hypothetical protein [Candidatus Baltobacteraceae bacterium]
MRTRIASVLLVLASFALAGCHGGGGSSALPSMGSNGAITPQSLGTGAGTASFTVNIPAASAASGTIPQSVVIALASGNGKMTPLTMNLRSTTTGCKALIGGGLTCVATVSAPIGADAFTIATYSGPNGTGSKITSAQTKASVQAFNKSACTPTRSDLKSLQSAG